MSEFHCGAFGGDIIGRRAEPTEAPTQRTTI
jgi:hypothetical protein